MKATTFFFSSLLCLIASKCLASEKVEPNKKDHYKIALSSYGYNKNHKVDIPFDKERLFDLHSDSVWTRGSTDGIEQWSLTEVDPHNLFEQKILYTYNPNITTAIPLHFAVNQSKKKTVTSFSGRLIEVANLEDKTAYTFRLPNPYNSNDPVPVAIDNNGTIFVATTNVARVITDGKEKKGYNLNKNVPPNTTITALKYKEAVGLATLYNNQNKNLNEIIVWDPQQKTQRIKTEPFSYEPKSLPSHFDFDSTQIIVQSSFDTLTVFSKKSENSPDTEPTTFQLDLASKIESVLNQLVSPVLIGSNKAACLYLSPAQHNDHNSCYPRTIVFNYDIQNGKITNKTELMTGLSIYYDKNTAGHALIQLFFDKKENLLNSMSNGGTSQYDILSLVNSNKSESNDSVNSLVNEFKLLNCDE